MSFSIPKKFNDIAFIHPGGFYLVCGSNKIADDFGSLVD